MGYATAYGLLMGTRRAVPRQIVRNVWNVWNVRYVQSSEGEHEGSEELSRGGVMRTIPEKPERWEQERWRQRRRERERLKRKRRKKEGQEPEPERIVTLAIETSCDDTCVAVLERRPTSTRLLFNSKVTSDNRKFGGIEPITAVSSHASQLAPLMQAAAEALPPTSMESGLPDFDPVTNRLCGRRRRPDFITVTRGPGLTSALSVGLTAAKGLAAAWKVPLVAVHHMQAHALTPRLIHALKTSKKLRSSSGTIQKQNKEGKEVSEAPDPNPVDWEEHWQEPEPAFPFLSLLVSGGHTQLVLSKSVTSHTILADALNIAIGDMLDKCARAILPPDVLAETDNVMYGARLESFAFRPLTKEEKSLNPEDPYEAYYGYTYHPPLKRRDEIQPYVSPTYGWSLTPPLSERRDMAFDFSGLGGQVQAIMKKNPDMDIPQRRELARETMRLAFEHLVTRIIFALDRMREQDREVNKKRMGQSTTTTATTEANQEAEPANATSTEAGSKAIKAAATTTIITTTPPSSPPEPQPTETTTADPTITTTVTNDEATTTATTDSETTATDPATPTTANPTTTTATDAASTASSSSSSSSVPKTLVVAGGVAANRFLQHILHRMLAARGYPPETLTIVRPPTEFCTDNAAMVAWAGMEMWEAGWYSDLNVLPQRRWPLDDGSGDEGKGGILGLDGWLPRSQLMTKEQRLEAEMKKRERLLDKLAKEIEAQAVGDGFPGKETGKAGTAGDRPEDWTIHWNDWKEEWGKPPEPGQNYDWAADWEDWDKFEERQRLRAEERRRERLQRRLEARMLTAWVGKLKKRQRRKLERRRQQTIKLKYQ